MKSLFWEWKGWSLFLFKEFVVYEDIIIRDFLLDGNFRGGGLFVVDFICVIVENVYVVYFEMDGILVEGGYENVICDLFIG